MNSRLPKRTVSPREKPLHVKHSPSAETTSEEEGTIGTSKRKGRYKSPFLVRQLLVFSTMANYGVVKIIHSNSEVVMRIMKYTMIYPDSDLSLEVIALCPII
jgi:hypothetical protein